MKILKIVILIFLTLPAFAQEEEAEVLQQDQKAQQKIKRPMLLISPKGLGSRRTGSRTVLARLPGIRHEKTNDKTTIQGCEKKRPR
jgi:hypothetical protein